MLYKELISCNTFTKNSLFAAFNIIFSVYFFINIYYVPLRMHLFSNEHHTLRTHQTGFGTQQYQGFILAVLLMSLCMKIEFLNVIFATVSFTVGPWWSPSEGSGGKTFEKFYPVFVWG